MSIRIPSGERGSGVSGETGSGAGVGKQGREPIRCDLPIALAACRSTSTVAGRLEFGQRDRGNWGGAGTRRHRRAFRSIAAVVLREVGHSPVAGRPPFGDDEEPRS